MQEKIVQNCRICGRIAVKKYPFFTENNYCGDCYQLAVYSDAFKESIKERLAKEPFPENIEVFGLIYSNLSKHGSGDVFLSFERECELILPESVSYKESTIKSISDFFLRKSLNKVKFGLQHRKDNEYMITIRTNYIIPKELATDILELLYRWVMRTPIFKIRIINIEEL